MTWPQVLAGAAAVAILVGAGAAVIRAWRALWSGLQRLVRLMDDLQGEPARPGVEARPGVMERLASIETGQHAARDDAAQLREEVARLSSEQAAAVHRIAAIERELPTLRDAVDKLADQGRPKIEAGGIGFQAEIAA